ncbi:unnamed protein product [Prorocentrum cordatum]|uniref:Uncharacterized protein n=1 Tax=Prorocentrum cordatum TaxID=2364126 RepID=A0ABN9TXP7_9DINO|nr:unnamed protein product [Polarella glacialis]
MTEVFDHVMFCAASSPTSSMATPRTSSYGPPGSLGECSGSDVLGYADGPSGPLLGGGPTVLLVVDAILVLARGLAASAVPPAVRPGGRLRQASSLVPPPPLASSCSQRGADALCG